MCWRYSKGEVKFHLVLERQEEKKNLRFLNEMKNNQDKYNDEEKKVKSWQQELVKQNYFLSFSFVALSLLAAVSDNRKLPLSIHMFGQFPPMNASGIQYLFYYALFTFYYKKITNMITRVSA